MKYKRCLVLGGNGFLGSHIVEALVRKGFSVTVYGRFNEPKLNNLKSVFKKIKVIKGDFIKAQNLEKAVSNADYVFHYIWIGNPAFTYEKPNIEIESNLLPTLKLLDLCLKHKVKKVIFPSSGGAIYGNSTKNKMSENDSPEPFTPYGITKLAVEKLLNFYKSKGLDYVIFRISNAFGPRQIFQNGQGLIPYLIDRINKQEQIIIYGDPIRDYVPIKEVSALIAGNFFKNLKFDTYNIGSGKGISVLNLLKVIEQVLNKKAILKKENNRPFDVKRIVLNTDRIKKEFKFDLNKNIKLQIENMLN